MLRTLFAILLAMGLLLLTLGWERHRDDHAAAGWVPVPARVVGLQVRSPMRAAQAAGPLSASAGWHIPIVVFEWTVAGHRYRSTRYRLEGPLTETRSREAARSALADFRIGQRLTAYRHPRAPERAVLSREGSAAGLQLAACGLVMSALAILGLLRAEQIARAFRCSAG